jgi:hypothetical protein
MAGCRICSVAPGDLGFALTDQQRETAGHALFVRDEVHRILTETVPVRKTVVQPGQPGQPLLVVLASPPARASRT